MESILVYVSLSLFEEFVLSEKALRSLSLLMTEMYPCHILCITSSL